MIKISVECIEENNKKELQCNGKITGKGSDIRREMVGALLMFDEVHGGKILCDALGEFLMKKMERVENEDNNNIDDHG